MKFLSFVLAALIGVTAQAQILDFAQSSPSVKWKTISNESVQLIYPDYLQAESVYIANLVEHYSQFVGKTYGITNPQQFSLIIRPETAQPNGYVTLGPRRSEWFASSTFMPTVGSSEWYQTLSIHEYRHVNQFDYFNRSGTKFLYYIMGDMGEQVAIFLSLPSWYFEGDAVWAETKYTDAGRGRSPRFMARMKALALSEKIPTYDQFLNGTYKTDLPNQYVYGYVLISYGTQKYGDDLWKKVVARVAQFPNPFRLYSAFENITGQPFRDFYYEAMSDLKTKWSKDALTGERTVEFRENVSPFKVGGALYYVNDTLDTYPTLYKLENGSKNKVAEFLFNKEFMKLDVKATKAVYPEFLPDSRYQHRGFSDLVLLDLKTGSKKKITSQERLYNPSLNSTETKILATEFKPDQSWNISEFDLEGQHLQSFTLSEGKVAELQYIDDVTAAAIMNSKTGHKSLVLVDLKEKKVTKVLLPESRNLINSLYVDKKKNILFEAQYKGYNEIFKINSAGEVARCSQSKIGAFTPSSDGENIYYSEEDLSGSKITGTSLASCVAMPGSDLVDFKYLGDTPSDSYNGFAPQVFPDQAQLFTKNSQQYRVDDYGDFDSRLAVPNSWGLLIGRGGSLGVVTDNYLRTLSFVGEIGSSPEELKGYAYLGFDIKKFYPLFNVHVENRGRAVEEYFSNDKTEWTENTVGVDVTVPYTKKRGLYNVAAILYGNADYVNASDYEFNKVPQTVSNYFYRTNSSLLLAWAKDKVERSLMAPWLTSYRISYGNAEQPSDSAYSSYRVYQQATLQTPGGFKHDGFKFTYDQQKQEDTPTAYHFLPQTEGPGSYTFSRGYSYRSVPEYQKLSGNYLFPVAYPDWTIEKWYYLRRLYANVFFDSTVVKPTANSDVTLNSYGAELFFESKVFRIVPLTFGLRVLQRLQDNTVRGDFFLASGLQF